MLEEGLIFEREVAGSSAVSVPDEPGLEERVAGLLAGVPLRRTAPRLPEVTEAELCRHFTRLSQRNYGVDLGFYPLGSCTMKYNPKPHEQLVRLPGLAGLHPQQHPSQVQGMLSLLWDLQQILLAVSGMDAVTLQPPAGAQGEFTALLCFRAYHQARGEAQRTRIIVPDSSHGTNPASATRCGMTVETIPSNERGQTNLDALREALDDRVAGVMITNPNTVGLFEEQVIDLNRIVHAAGALTYCDGANMNAIAGIVRPGDLGFDAMHFNTHKTFSTPHGGGGPGAGPVAVKAALEPFLPVPRIVRDAEGRFALDNDRPQSVGMVHSFLGNVGVLVRAYAYLLTLGPAGLRAMTERAVLNANYLLSRVRGAYQVAYEAQPMHEFVLTAEPQQKATGCRALDIAKRLLDFGFHPPTIYFPLIVHEAMMVEPTETETKATLDAFAEALLAIARECEESPELLHAAPTGAFCSRLDEATAARKPNVRWRPESGADA